jgi:hypothetical protein
VVPFDGRLLCAACIARANEPPSLPEKSSQLSGQLLLGTAALVFIWLIFYCLGWIILQYRETLPLDTNAEKADTNLGSAGLAARATWQPASTRH